MKQQVAGVSERRHSFAFGRDRLMLGWLTGDDAAFDGFEGMVPVAGVAGSSADALGKLDALLALLAEAHAVCAQPRSASDWSDWLRGWLQRLLAADPHDADEGAALDAVFKCAGALRRECDGAGVDPDLGWPAVREALSLRLAEVPRQQRFLPGGVTFCGMVPARVIPFRVVCLLGMNDGEFPREGSASALDLMQRAPRAGDRDARREDRYLFLESLMAAREVLHLSYVGESAADGSPRNPAAPLAELLELLDARHGIDALKDEERDAARTWVVRHALQPFDAAYFDGSDARRFSYAQDYAAAAPSLLPRDPRPFANFAHERDTATVGALDLAALQRALRDLPRHALQQGFGIRLDALDSDEGGDSEPLEARLDARDAIPQRLLRTALAEGMAHAPAAPPAWLAGSGLLPPGLPGEQAYADLARHVDAALQWVADEQPSLSGAGARPRTASVVLGDGSTLGGTLTRVFDGEAGAAAIVFEARVGGTTDLRSLLSLFVEWALLALSLPDDAPLPRAVLLCTVADKDTGQVGATASPEAARWSEGQADRLAHREDLSRRLTRLVALVREAEQTPAWLPPRTTWSYLAAKPGRSLGDARATWEGRSKARGESDWANYALLAGRGAEALQPGTPANARFRAMALLLAEVLELPTAGLEVAP
jgi:exodeoxyribonuclease V gamma subunit